MQSSSDLTEPIYSASHLHNPHSTNLPSNENGEVENKETTISKVETVLDNLGSLLWRKGTF